MTSGNLNITIGDCHIEGNFVSGFLRDGVVLNGDKCQFGTFDNEFKLNGENCVEKTKSEVRSGTFINGKLVSGTIVSNGLLEEGLFDRYLVSGQRVTHKGTYTGIFKFGKITEGTFKSIYGVIYSGSFNYYQRPVKCEMFDPRNGFRASFELSENKLKKCEVQYDGALEALSRNELILALCAGPNCENSCEFYLEHLAKFPVNVVREMIRVLPCSNFTQHLCVKQISKNMSKYLEGIAETSQEDAINLFDFDRYCSHD